MSAANDTAALTLPPIAVKKPPTDEKDAANNSAEDRSGDRSTGDEFDTTEFSESTKTVASNTSEDDSYGASNRFLKRAKKFIGKQAKNFVKNFVDYGPPYADQPFSVDLVNCCANPVLNHLELHNLLNRKLDPNIPDPQDLYDTPIHWCARNAHYVGLKMLRRAGARWDITNELGLTPLHLAVMMKFPPTKVGDQNKVVRYLLENGADVNIRDKGGFCPIDHAAANNNPKYIELLLEHGAKLMRENHILVAKRHHILRHVYDPECYRLLYTALIKEEEEYYRMKKIRDQVDELKAQDDYYESNLKTLNKLKAKKETRRKLLEETKRTEDRQQDYLQRIQQEMEQNLRDKHRIKAEQGIWQKVPSTGNWEFNVHAKKQITSQSIYNTNREIMQSLRQENEISRVNKTWKRLTEGGKIELPWKKDDPFILPEERANAYAASSNLLGNTVMSTDGTIKTKEELEAEERRKKQSVDVEYHDENDDELIGMDLDSFVSGLKKL